MVVPPEQQSVEELAHLDRRLAWLRADLEQYVRLGARVETTRRRLAEAAGRLRRLRERVDREHADVQHVEGLSFARVVEQLFGDIDARVAKETHEWLAARLRLEDTEHEINATKAELGVLESRLAALPDPREAYHALLAEKSRWLAGHPAEAAVHQEHLAERHGVLTDAVREFDEALWAGAVARAALAGVLHALSRAQALGRLDMLGLSSNLVKYEHLDDAQRHASAANRALSRFQMELADVQARHDAHLTFELGQLATFADYFFDDFVSDWVVQRRIDRSHASAAIARGRVARTLRALTRRHHELQTELRVIRERQERLAT